MAATELTKADFQSDQETRWCPGCGDYAVLAAVQAFFPELGIPPERIVFVSGIGCAGRFAYYMDTYGMHGIHGRGPALATGLAAAREDLSIWVVTGDGDALSIGGNHLIHALRRNVPVKILLFNNQIYGLTKGQASPTSELGKVTKSTPFGSIDGPFNPVSLALGAEASFVARTIDTDKHHLTDGAARRGRARGRVAGRDLPELPGVQRRRVRRAARQEAGRGQPDSAGARPADPVRRRGRERRRARSRRRRCGSRRWPTSARTRWSCTTRTATTRRWRSRCRGCRRTPDGPTPIGIFRQVSRPVSGRDLTEKLALARAGAGDAELDAALHAGDTWTVS